MRIIENIVLFFKRIFKKEENIKMIEAPSKEENGRRNFINSLKTDAIKKKRKVETLTCIGDGLGIQNKIEY